MIFLTFGQIVRGLATRKFLSSYTPIRHRFIFGLNGIGSFVNLLIPFRAGDIIRLIFFSRKKLGILVCAYFIISERIIDLFIANTVFFTLGYFRDDLKFSSINYAGWVVGTFGLLLLFFGKSYLRMPLKSRGFLPLTSSFQLVFTRRALALFCLSLVGSWGFTSLAFLILGKRYSGIVQDWVSLNSNFSDPLSLALSVYNLLFVTLLIPLILAYFYSLSIPSPHKVSWITINEFIGIEQFVVEILPFKSKYAGSGADLYLAKTIHKNSKQAQNYVLRVEHSRESNLETASFMKHASPQFKFPKIYYEKDFINARCTILESIVNFDTGAPARNVFEHMSEESNSLNVLEDVVSHIFDFHSENIESASRVFDEELLEKMKNRIIRTRAFVFLTLNFFKSEDRKRIARFNEFTNRLLMDSDRLSSRFVQGICHGDASLSNFLVQEIGDNRIIRSIDPNTRFPVANIEFDLAKVMQSTHALYEFSLGELNQFPSNKNEFLQFQHQLGWGSRLIDIISDKNNFNNMDWELLRFFLMVHLIRIIPYKVQSGQDSLRHFLDLIDWVDELVNF